MQFISFLKSRKLQSNHPIRLNVSKVSFIFLFVGFLFSFLSTSPSIVFAANSGSLFIEANDRGPLCPFDTGPAVGVASIYIGNAPTNTTGLLGFSDACETGVVPAPRLGLTPMYYPFYQIGESNAITFNMGYAGGKRNGRCHVGLDIYPRGPNKMVRSITDGTILKKTGPGWNGSQNLCGIDVLVVGADGVQYILRYGEVDCHESTFQNLQVGSIRAGQDIGVVTGETGVIHIELHLYDGNEDYVIAHAGQWTTPAVTGTADYCAVNVFNTNMCTSSNEALRRLLNVRNIVIEGAEQTWPGESFGPPKDY